MSNDCAFASVRLGGSPAPTDTALYCAKARSGSFAITLISNLKP